MMASLMLFPPASIPQPTCRLAVGLALSVLVHLLLMAGVRPMATAYAPPKPFQVEIRQAESRPDTPFTVTGESGYPASVAAMPQPADPGKTEMSPPNTAAAPVAGLDLKIILDDYYTSREVDVRAEPVNDVQLVYPRLAYQNRVRGKVMLRILINERGGIDQVSVLESEPRGTFEEAALTATWALQFSPAKKHGRSVKSRKDIEVILDPYESINVP